MKENRYPILLFITVISLLAGFAFFGNVASASPAYDYIITPTGTNDGTSYTITPSGGTPVVKTTLTLAIAECTTDLNGDSVVTIQFGDGSEALNVKPESQTGTGAVTATYTGKIHVLETGMIAGSGLTIRAGITVTFKDLTMTNEASQSNNLTVLGTGILNVTDGSNIRSTELGGTRNMITNQGTINVSGGEIYSAKTRMIVGGTVNISGGKLTSDSPYVGESIVSGNRITITGGELHAAKEAIRIGNGAQASISGGTIYAGSYGVVMINGARLDMTGGTIESDGTGISYSSGTIETTINISSGTLKGVIAINLAGKGTTTITGGDIISPRINYTIYINDDSSVNDSANAVTISGGKVFSEADSAVYIGSKSKSHVIVTGTAILESKKATANTISLSRSGEANSNIAYASIFGTRIYNSQHGQVAINGKTGVAGHEAAHKVIKSDTYTGATVTASNFVSPNTFIAWLYSLSPEQILSQTNGVTVGVLDDDFTSKGVGAGAKNVYLKVGTYTVNYDAKGGTVSPDSKNVTNGSAYGSLATPTWDDHRFDGWYLTDDYQPGTQVQSNTVVNITYPSMTQTLYAKWSVKVNFNINGGDTAPSDKYFSPGSTYGTDLPSSGFTRSGYTFNGWFTATSGGTKVESTTTVSSVPHSLYAQWTPNAYTVSFDLNGGSSAAPSDASITFDTAYSLPASDPTRDKYTFTGWFTAASGGDQVTGTDTLNTAANHTLYAQWRGQESVVTFNLNGGSSVSTNTQSVFYGAAYGELPVATKDQEGAVAYSFQGWHTATTGGALITSSTIVDEIVNHTLYAHWATSPTYNVIYSGNGSSSGTPPADNSHYVSGSLITVATNTGNLARTGYIFKGWATTSTGLVEYVETAGTVSPPTFNIGNSDVTLYAAWEPIDVTVTFDKNSTAAGAPDPASKSVKFDAKYGVLADIIRTGYNFLGWFTDQILGLKVETNTIVLNPFAHSLYAQWEAKNFTITYDPKGGKIAGENDVDIMSHATAIYDYKYGQLKSVTRDGYTFDGWYLTDSYTPATIISSTDTVAITSNSNLYAKWVPLTDTPYRVEHYQQNVADNGYSLVDYDEFTGTTEETASAVALSYIGFTENTSHASRKESGAILGNGSLALKFFYDRNTYSVEFLDIDGSTVATDTEARHGATLSKPSSPTMPGYTFVGWYKDTLLEDPWDFSTDQVTADTVLFAKWKVSAPSKKGSPEELQPEDTETGQHIPYINGYADGTFKPDQSITRAEMAAIFARNLDFTSAKNVSSTYPDLKSTHWAVEEIEFVKLAGLMMGDSNGMFRPGAKITRGEMVAIAARYKKLALPTVLKSSFKDVDPGYWGIREIEAAYSAGIVDGYDDNNFRPNNLLTRAEAVRVVNRLFERGPLHQVDQPSWPDVPITHWAFKDIEEASRVHNYMPRESDGEDLVE